MPEQALLEVLQKGELRASVETREELASVLEPDKFDRYSPQESRRGFMAPIRRTAAVFVLSALDIASVVPAGRDPKDDKFLALALTVEADVLISSDQDLLMLYPWRGIEILAPAEFLYR